jgi:hypothetical protein
MYGGAAMWVLPRISAMVGTTKMQHLIMPRMNAIPYNTKRAPKRSFRMNICR